MSDNLTAQEIRRRLVIFLRIPTEVWTDVLKLLPRRTLVQQIAPTCYRFKEISNKNVKNVHVIENAGQFTKKLTKDDPEANQQLEQLAGNKCQLASHFRLTHYLLISEKSKAILNHCLDLFKGCKLALFIKEENKNSTLFLESLTEFEKAKLTTIRVNQSVDQLVDYWHHPTFLKCTRVDIDFRPNFDFVNAVGMTAFENIFDWLHHKPIEMDCDGFAADQDRCLIIWCNTPHIPIDLLINRCSESIRQVQQPIDRRPYVLSFESLDWSGFGQFRRFENKSTGEVLTLERKMRASGEATDRYRLRRCLVEEEGNGAVFYAEMFENQYPGIDDFNIADDTPDVLIGEQEMEEEGNE